MTVTDIQTLTRKYEKISKELNLLKKNIELLNENVLEIKQDRKRMSVKQIQDDRVFVDLVLEIKDMIKELEKGNMQLIARVDKLEKKLQ